jgi:peptidoglycan/xylan/chitin deacetylase (PgdA/CDA1 family)
MLTVSLGIDVEPDCPPYLATQYRGVVEGLPKFLDAVDGAGIPTTCFCTGAVAEKFPQRITDLVKRGHELASHGHAHLRFDRLTDAEARRDIDLSTDVLRAFGSAVTSFRAPYLQFPNRYLPLLEQRGYRVDSSQARYKAAWYVSGKGGASRGTTKLTRIPASMTSSVLRLSSWLRDPWLLALSSPVVLFVHPWEFVDLRRERLRLDCRFRTGDAAIDAVLQVVKLFASRGARFVRMSELEPTELKWKAA